MTMITQSDRWSKAEYPWAIRLKRSPTISQARDIIERSNAPLRLPGGFRRFIRTRIGAILAMFDHIESWIEGNCHGPVECVATSQHYVIYAFANEADAVAVAMVFSSLRTAPRKRRTAHLRP